MGMVILIVLIAFIIGIFFAIRERSPENVAVMLLLGVLCAVVWAIFGMLFGKCFFTERTYDTKITPLCAITNSTETKNSYILCVGSSRQNLYYYYWSEEEDGAKTLHSINSDKIKIYENKEEENPRIETHYLYHPNPVVRFFFLGGEEQTFIYIPKGSIGTL